MNVIRKETEKRGRKEGGESLCGRGGERGSENGTQTEKERKGRKLKKIKGDDRKRNEKKEKLVEAGRWEACECKKESSL